MFIKSFTKKKQNELSARNFTIDLKRLDTYSFEKLKDYVQKYERYTERMTEDYRLLKEDFETLAEENEQLEAYITDICDVNIDLNNDLMLSEFKDNFIEVFRMSLKSILNEAGLRDFGEIANGFGEFKLNLESLLAESDKIRKRVMTEEKEGLGSKKDEASKLSESNGQGVKGEEDTVEGFKPSETTTTSDKTTHNAVTGHRSLLKDLETLNTELNSKMKIINRCVEGLEGDYEQLLNSVEGLYMKLATESESGMLERYKLNDIMLISGEKMKASTKAWAVVKKDLTKKTSEIKILEKNNQKLSKDNCDFKTKISELEENIANLKRNLDSISDLKNVNESEMSGHVELLRILQEENYKTNATVHELRAKNLDQEKFIFTLRDDKKKLEDKLADIDTKHISALRQERLKLEHLKRDLEALEEKCRDYNMMLKAENAKYETLYKKYKELNHENYKNLKNIDAMKKVTTSFEETTDKYHRNNTSTISTVNRSMNERVVANTEFNTKTSKKFVKKDEEIEQYKQEIEDLKLKVVTADVHMATERNIFSQLLKEKEVEIEVLTDVNLSADQRAGGEDQLSDEQR